MGKLHISEEEKNEIRKKYNLSEQTAPAPVPATPVANTPARPALNVQVHNGVIVLNGVQYKLQAKTIIKTFTITVKSLTPATSGYNITYIHPVTQQIETKPIRPETIDTITRNIGQPSIELPGGKTLTKV